jgi:peptidoglycan/LPS O-acetylase OafA/YrhL
VVPKTIAALRSESSSRYHSLDIWRGIACLSVIVFHAVGIDGSPGPSETFTTLGHLAMRGWIGVPLFFVISGYCIAASASRPQPFSDYFLRRLRRIFPPLWIFLGLTALIVLAIGAAGLWNPIFGYDHGGTGPIVLPTRISIWQNVANFTLTAGWLSHLGGPFWRF